MVAAALSLPEISAEDRHILLRFFAHRGNIAALAAELATAHQLVARLSEAGESPTLPASPTPHSHLPTHDLLSLHLWAASPRITPYIELERTAAEKSRRRLALDSLEAVLRESQDLIEKRRAASAILRAPFTLTTPDEGKNSDDPAIRTSKRSNRRTTRPRDLKEAPETVDHIDPEDVADDDASDEADDAPPETLEEAYTHKPGDFITPPETPIPDLDHTPEDIIEFTLAALQSPDDPTPDAGLITLYNLQGHYEDRTPAALKTWITDCFNHTGNISRFKRAEPIYRKAHHGYVLQRFTLHFPGGVTSTLSIQVRKCGAGPLVNCWLLHHLSGDREPDTT